MFYQNTKVTMKGIAEIRKMLEEADEQLHALMDTIDKIRKCSFEFGIEIIQPSEEPTAADQLSLDECKAD